MQAKGIWRKLINHSSPQEAKLFTVKSKITVFRSVCFVKKEPNYTIHSLSHTKIPASITKSLNQYCGLSYLTLPIFLLIHTLLYYREIKSCCDCWFPLQITPQMTVQLYILWDYSSARIGFNMINKCLTPDTTYSIYHASLIPLRIVLLWVKQSMW